MRVLLAAVFIAVESYAAIAVNSVVEAGNDSTNTLAAPSVNMATGESAWVFVGIRDPCSGKTITVSDTASNTYTALTAHDNTTNICTRVFYKENMTGNSANVVTASVSGCTSNQCRFISIHVVYITGAATSSALDVNSVNDDNIDANVVSSAFSTSQANEAVIFFVKSYSGGTTEWVQGNIGGSAATEDGFEPYAGTSMINYRVTSATISSGTANMTTPATVNTLHVISVKEAGGAAPPRRRVIVVE